MQRFCKTKGIVIKRRRYQEADLILVVLSEDLGKIELRARGIRKAKSKMRGQAELFNLVQLEFIYGRTWETVVGLQTINPFRGLKKDLKRQILAHFIAEFIDKFVSEKARDRRLYQIVRDIFLSLDSSSERLEYLQKVIWGQWRLLEHLGFAPRFDQCIDCGRPLGQGPFWQGVGGLYCAQCLRRPRGSVRVDQETFYSLAQKNWMKEKDLESLEKINFVFAHYLNLSLPYRLETMEWLSRSKENLKAEMVIKKG